MWDIIVDGIGIASFCFSLIALWMAGRATKQVAEAVKRATEKQQLTIALQDIHQLLELTCRMLEDERFDHNLTAQMRRLLTKCIQFQVLDRNQREFFRRGPANTRSLTEFDKYAISWLSTLESHCRAIEGKIYKLLADE